MSEQRRLAVLQRHLDAENAHDLPAIMASYAATPRVVINGRAIEGRARVEAFHARFGFGGNGTFQDVHVRERHRHATASAIVIEQTLSGTHPASGPFTVEVCTVYRFASDGLLESETVYFDDRQISR